MDRRDFLRVAVVGAAAAFGGAAWAPAFAANSRPGASPYGALAQNPDANGLFLPKGFSSRIVARSGQTVPGTNYRWHPAPDGGACFPRQDGWIYVSNSEVKPDGGASAIAFDADGSVASAYRILSDTRQNCAGGATPWGKWLSCEEVDRGLVFEADPTGATAAVSRPAMGRFKHEACAVDPDRKVVYMTEDVSDGRFYRFTPTNYPDLSAGKLEALVASSDSGPVTWAPIDDPSGGSTETRYQARNSKEFDGGEGCYYADGTCWFTTKGDNRVWAYDAVNGSLSLAYTDGSPLNGVDNITGASNGDLFVAEDGDNMEICVIADGLVAPFLRIDDSNSSEITGPAFSPAGDRLYFSSQRGTEGSSDAGITYEVTGPFRRKAPEPTAAPPPAVVPAQPAPPAGAEVVPTTAASPSTPAFSGLGS